MVTSVPWGFSNKNLNRNYILELVSSVLRGGVGSESRRGSKKTA